MTTNERAREWAEKKLREHHNYETMSDKARKVWLESYMGDYMQIATEQKAIDIDKAKAAFCHKCFLAYDDCKKHCLAYKHFSEAIEDNSQL